jgi:hypothetical protein
MSLASVKTSDFSISLGKYAPKKDNGKDGKYFSTTKKGELHELKNELCSLDKEKIKEAVKKNNSFNDSRKGRFVFVH